MPNWSQGDLEVYQSRRKRKTNKYNATRVEVDGIRFDSKREAAYYLELKLRVRAGEVLYFLRQVPIHLPGGVVYRCDFVEFYQDAPPRFVDVKGFETPTFKLKKKQVEALYPLKIHIVK